MHPESEFVIPLAHGERRLAAYRLEDISAEYLEQIQPDYILEYFEDEANVDPARVTEDANWLRFLGGGQIVAQRPKIQVNLRPYRREGTP